MSTKRLDLTKEAQEYSFKHKVRPGAVGRWVAEKLFSDYSSKMDVLRDADELLRGIAIGQGKTGLPIKTTLENANKSFKNKKYIDSVYWMFQYTEILKEIIQEGDPIFEALSKLGLEHYTETEDPEALDYLTEKQKTAGAFQNVYRYLFGDPIENAYKRQVEKRKRDVESNLNTLNASLVQVLALFDRMGIARSTGKIDDWLNAYQGFDKISKSVIIRTSKVLNTISDVIALATKIRNDEQLVAKELARKANIPIEPTPIPKQEIPKQEYKPETKQVNYSETKQEDKELDIPIYVDEDEINKENKPTQPVVERRPRGRPRGTGKGATIVIDPISGKNRDVGPDVEKAVEVLNNMATASSTNPEAEIKTTAIIKVMDHLYNQFKDVEEIFYENIALLDPDWSENQELRKDFIDMIKSTFTSETIQDKDGAVLAVVDNGTVEIPGITEEPVPIETVGIVIDKIKNQLTISTPPQLMEAVENATSIVDNWIKEEPEKVLKNKPLTVKQELPKSKPKNTEIKSEPLKSEPLKSEPLKYSPKVLKEPKTQKIENKEPETLSGKQKVVLLIDYDNLSSYDRPRLNHIKSLYKKPGCIVSAIRPDKKEEILNNDKYQIVEIVNIGHPKEKNESEEYKPNTVTIPETEIKAPKRRGRPKKALDNIEKAFLKRSNEKFLKEIEKEDNKYLIAVAMTKYSEKLENIDEEASIELLKKAQELIDD
jgi:hypothetical protein